VQLSIEATVKREVLSLHNFPEADRLYFGRNNVNSPNSGFVPSVSFKLKCCKLIDVTIFLLIFS
jgi:hypothetical protein